MFFKCIEKVIYVYMTFDFALIYQMISSDPLHSLVRFKNYIYIYLLVRTVCNLDEVTLLERKRLVSAYGWFSLWMLCIFSSVNIEVVCRDSSEDCAYLCEVKRKLVSYLLIPTCAVRTPSILFCVCVTSEICHNGSKDYHLVDIITRYSVTSYTSFLVHKL